MRAQTLAALSAGRPALLLCDGRHEAATGLPAVCEHGCARNINHTGLRLRDGPDECQWRGKQERLSEVPLSSVGVLAADRWRGRRGPAAPALRRRHPRALPVAARGLRRLARHRALAGQGPGRERSAPKPAAET
jgi:hypothetical protein